MGVLHIDLESRSGSDLPKQGLHIYAGTPSTEILCVGFAFDEEPVQIWFPHVEPLPSRLYHHVFNQCPTWAHNAAFEFHMWNEIVVKRYHGPRIVTSSIHCTMAAAYAMGIPGSLEKAAAAMGIKEQKDMKGSRLMMRMCKPLDIGQTDSQEDLNRLGEYCKQDVRVERELHKRLLPLSEEERKVWLMDFEINERGVAVDIHAVEAASAIVEIEQERLSAKMREITDNEVATYNANGQLKDFLNLRGVEVESVGAPTITELLANEDLDPFIRKVLEIRKEGAKSSVAKLKLMKSGCLDNRIRGLFQYHAAATGRWGGRRLQPQNFPRNKISQQEIENIFDLLKGPTIEVIDAIDMFYGPPISIISDCLRGFLVASPDHELIAVDFSQIEARILPWLAGQEDVLDVFRQNGKIYEYAAAGIYHVPVEEVNSTQRQIGKIAILSLGFGGGKIAFQGMAQKNGLSISADEAENTKVLWRNKNQKIVAYWSDLEEAAIQAVFNPNTPVFAGAKAREVVFKTKGSFLWCKLPSGRVLCYPYPEIKPVETPWGEMRDALTYMGEDTYSKKWSRQKTYGGSLAENVTQAVARDVLVQAMFTLKNMRMNIVLHVHDEIVIEMPISSHISNELIEGLVTKVPEWAQGLPIAAKAWVGRRYRK